MQFTYIQEQQHPFNGPLSGTIQVSWYQKGKTSLDLLEQETVSGSGISWAMCKSAPCPRQLHQHHTTQFFTDRMPFLPPNQQHQSNICNSAKKENWKLTETDVITFLPVTSLNSYHPPHLNILLQYPEKYLVPSDL